MNDLAALWHHDVFCMRTKSRTWKTDHFIARFERSYIAADDHDDPREFRSKHRLSRLSDSKEKPRHKPHTGRD